MKSDEIIVEDSFNRFGLHHMYGIRIGAAKDVEMRVETVDLNTSTLAAERREITL
jgi:hypothetical protein